MLGCNPNPPRRARPMAPAGFLYISAEKGMNMEKLKVASSASYFNNPAVRAVLAQQDLIMTTNADVVSVLTRLFSCPVVCIPNAGSLSYKEQVTAFVNLFYPHLRGGELKPEDIEVTGYGDLMRLNEANLSGCKVGIEALLALWKAERTAIDALEEGLI